MHEETRRSATAGLISLQTWYGIFGIIVAALALANFTFSLLHVKPALVINALLSTYRAIVHGSFDWVLYLAPWKPTAYVKDVLFLYCLVGGASMRSRAATVEPAEKPSLYEALRILVVPSKKTTDGAIPAASRITAMYWYAPTWFRRLFDFSLWPRVVYQYFDLPVVRVNSYNGRKQFFKAGYRSQKEFLYDRRVVLLIQLIAIATAFFAVVVVNAFLTVPK